MKVAITYPHVMINTVEIEVPDDTEVFGLTDEEIVEVLKKHDEQLPGYDEPDYHMLDRAIDSGSDNLFSINLIS